MDRCIPTPSISIFSLCLCHFLSVVCEVGEGTLWSSFLRDIHTQNEDNKKTCKAQPQSICSCMHNSKLHWIRVCWKRTDSLVCSTSRTRWLDIWTATETEVLRNQNPTQPYPVEIQGKIGSYTSIKIYTVDGFRGSAYTRCTSCNNKHYNLNYDPAPSLQQLQFSPLTAEVALHEMFNSFSDYFDTLWELVPGLETMRWNQSILKRAVLI